MTMIFSDRVINAFYSKIILIRIIIIILLRKYEEVVKLVML